VASGYDQYPDPDKRDPGGGGAADPRQPQGREAKEEFRRRHPPQWAMMLRTCQQS
jgi:hypothetical protein